MMSAHVITVDRRTMLIVLINLKGLVLKIIFISVINNFYYI